MKAILGKKQSTNNEDWLKAMNEIETLVTKEELDSLVQHTVNDILIKTTGKKVAFAWSGGKDSLVLEHLCYMASIEECVLVICNMEYKAFLQWVTDNMPKNLEVINTGQDIEWLSRHQDMLFPEDSSIAAKWFHIVQHRGQNKYYKNHNLDMMLLGRRKSDGNYVGKGANIYTDGNNVTRYSPLSDWKHEYILAYIHYYSLKVPPFYDWVNGFYCGTHPWSARQWTGSVENGWKEICSIDKEIVREAAELIPSAKAFIESGVA